MEGAAPWIFQIAMGIGLAACAGLRMFVPALAVAVAGKAGWIPLADSFAWMGSWAAIVVFGVAVLVEVLADKIPAVDNVLDAVQVFAKPAAGAMLAVSVITELDPLTAMVLGIVSGATTAGIVQLLKAKLRLASSAMTLGTVNPVLSVAEDVTVVSGSAVALAAPFVLIAALAGGGLLAWYAFRRWRRPAVTS